MINRELIRLKVVQLVYAYYGNEGRDLEAAEKEFVFSLSKTYELYHVLLQLMVSINYIARRTVEMNQNRAQRLGDRNYISPKFVNNRFIAQLKANRQLQDFKDKQSILWTDDYEDFLRRTYEKITEQDYYKKYMQSGISSYEEDRELWRKIYRNVLCNNDELDEILEEQSLYWNDDKVIVDTFVLKTIRRFEEPKWGDQPLLPEFRDSEDQRFAVLLFRTAIQNEEYFRQLISEQTKNWDIERIAMMDLIIMQIALAELTTFPEIPLNVTLNEYVEIAKDYSTPRSSSYINGLLDTIAKRLIAEHKINK